MNRIQHLAKVRDVAIARRNGKATPKQLANAASKGLRAFERDLHRPGNILALLGLVVGVATVTYLLASGTLQTFVQQDFNLDPTTADGGGSGGSLPPDGHSW